MTLFNLCTCSHNCFGTPERRSRGAPLHYMSSMSSSTSSMFSVEDDASSVPTALTCNKYDLDHDITDAVSKKDKKSKRKTSILTAPIQSQSKKRLSMSIMTSNVRTGERSAFLDLICAWLSRRRKRERRQRLTRLILR